MQSSRILDRLTGRGGVERNGEIICEVDYEIIVSQPSAETKVETQSDTEAESRPDMPDARGRLRVLDGKRNLMEGDLTLRLNDGRKWKFTVTNGNPVSALYMVVQTGGDSLAPVQTWFTAATPSSAYQRPGHSVDRAFSMPLINRDHALTRIS